MCGMTDADVLNTTDIRPAMRSMIPGALPL